MTTAAEQLAKAQRAAARDRLVMGMLAQLRAVGLHVGMERERRFDPVRKWAFDMAWPALLLALEVEGGTYTSGRHTRGAGYGKDIEKYNEAALAGWMVIRADTKQVADGRALQWIERAHKTRTVILGHQDQWCVLCGKQGHQSHACPMGKKQRAEAAC